MDWTNWQCQPFNGFPILEFAIEILLQWQQYELYSTIHKSNRWIKPIQRWLDPWKLAIRAIHNIDSKFELMNILKCILFDCTAYVYWIFRDYGRLLYKSSWSSQKWIDIVVAFKSLSIKISFNIINNNKITCAA